MAALGGVAVPVWVVLFLLAIDGWIGFELWRGLARGEISNFKRYGSALIRKSDGAVRFWATWSIAAVSFLFLSVMIALLLLDRFAHI